MKLIKILRFVVLDRNGERSKLLASLFTSSPKKKKVEVMHISLAVCSKVLVLPAAGVADCHRRDAAGRFWTRLVGRGVPFHRCTTSTSKFDSVWCNEQRGKSRSHRRHTRAARRAVFFCLMLVFANLAPYVQNILRFKINSKCVFKNGWSGLRV